MQHTPHQMKYLLRRYCFSLLDLCQKRNCKNIALTYRFNIVGHFRKKQKVSYSTQFLGTSWQDEHFLKCLYTIVHLYTLVQTFIYYCTPIYSCKTLNYSLWK